MLIILDCSVVISYFSSRKTTTAGEIIKMAVKEDISIAVCDEFIQELQRTVASKQAKKVPQLDNIKVSRLVVWFMHNGARFIMPSGQPELAIRDKNAEYLLRLAEISEASYLLNKFPNSKNKRRVFN